MTNEWLRRINWGLSLKYWEMSFSLRTSEFTRWCKCSPGDARRLKVDPHYLFRARATAGNSQRTSHTIGYASWSPSKTISSVLRDGFCSQETRWNDIWSLRETTCCQQCIHAPGSVRMHCESKKHASRYSYITSTNLHRFSKFFNCWTLQ